MRSGCIATCIANAAPSVSTGLYGSPEDVLAFIQVERVTAD